MNDDIIRMGKEAGIGDCYLANPHPGVVQQLKRFAELVAAAEREAIAKMVEDWDSDSADPRDIAAAIRTRGNT